MQSVLCIIIGHDIRVEVRALFESRFGLLVFSAGNPFEGFAMLQKIDTPAFILMADKLILMTLEEFLQIKARDPKVSEIPVVLLSDDPNRKLPDGVCGLLNTPIDAKKVAEVVKKHCGIDVP